MRRVGSELHFSTVTMKKLVSLVVATTPPVPLIRAEVEAAVLGVIESGFAFDPVLDQAMGCRKDSCP